MQAARPFGLPLPLLCLLVLFVGVDASLISGLWTQPLGIDWTPLHAAARLPVDAIDGLYDFRKITAAQAPEIGTLTGLRPYVYPPSALLAFKPFAMLPFRLSYLAWVLVTGGFYLAAASRLSPRWWLLPLFPSVLLAGLAGQTGFLLGGMAMSALVLLDERPALAGLLLGVATAVKPQLFMLTPLALVSARHWRALAGWGAAGLGMILLTLALFGRGVWLAWLGALPRFETFFEHHRLLMANAMTPHALAVRMGWPGQGLYLLLAVPAILLVWRTFREGRPVADRLIALIGGALLVTPYAMNYELLLLAPALVAAHPTDARRMMLLLAVGISILFGLGAVGLVLAVVSIA